MTENNEMESREEPSGLETVKVMSLLGGALVLTAIVAGFLGSLDLIDRSFAFFNGKSYEESKQDMKKYIIDDFFKEYDTNKDGVIDKQEYGVWAQQRYIDRK